MKLLTVENAKTVKGEPLGYLTGILYLAPANESGVMNTCQYASPGCTNRCLFTSGRAQLFRSVNEARIRKTLELFNDRAGFMHQLDADITALIARADRDGLRPAVRLNGTSDLPWLALQLSARFPQVQFYDYTKLPRPHLRVRPNYHITFSLHESNLELALDALAHGINVAVVFDTRRGQPLPELWRGYPVIDGDAHDLRFLDARGSIVGLRAKGQAKDDVLGFVQLVRRTA